MSWKKDQFFRPRQATTITFDKETGQVQKVIKDGKLYEGLRGLIISQKLYIQECLKSKVTPNREFSEWKILLLDFILNSDHTEDMFNRYIDEKQKLAGQGLSPFDLEKKAIQILGWQFLPPENLPLPT